MELMSSFFKKYLDLLIRAFSVLSLKNCVPFSLIVESLAKTSLSLAFWR